MRGMAGRQEQSCAAREVDDAARLEPRVLKSLVVELRAAFSPNSHFAVNEREPNGPEDISCNHSDVRHVRLRKFSSDAEFDTGQEGHGQNLGLKRRRPSESGRLR